MSNVVNRGDIYFVSWFPARGSEQEGFRPAVIIQSNAGNQNPRYANTIIAALSTKGRDNNVQVRVDPTAENGLKAVSFVKCEQLMTIDKSRLSHCIGVMTTADMIRVSAALKRVLSL